MAKKISELTTISELSDSDLIPIVDVSANTTNKVTFSDLMQEKVGDLTELETTSKDTIVNAINNLASGEIVASNLGGTGYIKYSNGFMLQWQSKSITTSVSSWGILYYNDYTMDNWAIPFTSVFGSWTNSGHPQFWTTGGSPTTTNAGLVRVLRPNSANYSMTVTVYAIGLWK